ncbi:hypothetical protein CPAR01_12017 [Colletotrichum paranaense]|uniref:Uncharacterized protein n=5 Tax=Colletotrichum acutatum species complex TaxID=2707335 RepID=A0AAJ0DZI4_9PEZI|nr:uncharacterized protein CCOS01_08311 [Colletotrichum costaricense]XP_060345060.1 uncharacterized protein CPAR01_12017 [Colletotrichum paranaense]XP_060377801.1 uncharacterized protein CTAM01_11491 [Colletotrichum tamarilloi]KAK1469815.1 hypothetical protein CMEL01_01582 [Colletotrichum melonis]KAK1472795.1 hypothetical protein CCUS01_17265 [Colletotrichum cuscutae]KAK1488119.1 hypothetical protein CTAM01_11491 [Colletotrichum tamarilloi]KAK1525893.1 hypothetical protein CCOS01_08311 [Colle
MSASPASQVCKAPGGSGHCPVLGDFEKPSLLRKNRSKPYALHLQLC